MKESGNKSMVGMNEPRWKEPLRNKGSSLSLIYKE